jgi:sigma-E factor negative regulatory protein RseC
MIEQQGQVLTIDGSRARVRIGGTSGCPRCDAGKGCGAGVFGKLLQRKPAIIELSNDIDARIGQGVIVGMSETVFLQMVTRLYAIPLIAGLAGAGLGHYLSVRMAVDGAAADGIALLVGLMSGGAAIRSNRTLDREFPRKKAVHLLRAVSATGSDACIDAAGTTNKSEQMGIHR